MDISLFLTLTLLLISAVLALDNCPTYKCKSSFAGDICGEKITTDDKIEYTYSLCKEPTLQMCDVNGFETLSASLAVTECENIPIYISKR